MWSRGRGGNRGNRGGGRGRGGSGHWDRRGANRFRGNFSRGSRGGGHRDNIYNRPNDNSYNNDKSYSKKQSDIYVEKLNEIDVGVTEYINTLEGFTGVLKARYSDFHVNEIAMDGKIAKLTDLKVPVDPEPRNF